MNYLSLEENATEQCLKNLTNPPWSDSPLMHYKMEYPFERGVIKAEGKKLWIKFQPERIEIPEWGGECDVMGFWAVIESNKEKKAYGFTMGMRPIKEENGTILSDVYMEVIDIRDSSGNILAHTVDKDSANDRALMIAIFNIFHEVQSRALHSYKKLMLCKKYEKRAHEHDGQPENKVIHFDNGISYCWKNDDDEVRNFTWHCESWGVRGHIRHLKSGKEVFVKPYTKGKGRLKDSIYETI